MTVHWLNMSVMYHCIAMNKYIIIICLDTVDWIRLQSKARVRH